MAFKKKIYSLFVIVIVILNLFASSAICNAFLLLFLIFCVISSKKIIINTYADVWLFIAIVFITTVMSIVVGNNISLYEVVRGWQYCLMSMVCIYIGCYGNRFFIDSNHLLKISGNVGLIAGAVYLLIVIFTGDFSFSTLREGRINSVIAFIASAYIILALSKSSLYSARKDKVYALALSFISLIGFSRSNLLILAVAIFVGLLTNLKEHKRAAKTLVFIFSLVITAIIIIWYFLQQPDTLIGKYLQKIIYTAIELNTSQNISTEAEVNSNWRAFEIQNAKNQFANSALLEKIFGSGFLGVNVGTYAALVGGENNYIPLLHNGYYTVIIYSGILGLVLFVWFYVKKLFVLHRRRNEVGKRDREIFVAFIITYLVITYFINGMISKTVYFVPCAYIGFICAKMRPQKNRDSGKL